MACGDGGWWIMIPQCKAPTMVIRLDFWCGQQYDSVLKAFNIMIIRRLSRVVIIQRPDRCHVATVTGIQVQPYHHKQTVCDVCACHSECGQGITHACCNWRFSVFRWGSSTVRLWSSHWAVRAVHRLVRHCHEAFDLWRCQRRFLAKNWMELFELSLSLFGPAPSLRCAAKVA